GPVLAILGIAGFFAGIILIYLDYGRILKYPLHFINGLAVVFAIISTYLISRKITGADSPARPVHLRRGILLLSLYALQILLGAAILF
ncbi:MAG: DUF4079 family protein, partial [Nitrospirae bacterium]|nr:DUF4079 family protein [Nitrospirota bacterium]